VYSGEIKPKCKKVINKKCKKNPVLREAIESKIKEIIKNALHYKPLRYDFKGERRVHILKSFILIYEIDYSKKLVIFKRFTHHDKAYRR
jgi:YafQ family addiction module toxin component